MPLHRSALALLLALAACAAPPSGTPAPAPANAPHEPEYGLLSGTIGATVEAAAAGVVRVAALAPGGPAARAGLRAGDAIVACAGRAVRSVRDFNRCVVSASPGGRLDLDVLRGERREALEVEVAPLRTGWRA